MHSFGKHYDAIFSHLDPLEYGPRFSRWVLSIVTVLLTLVALMESRENSILMVNLPSMHRIYLFIKYYLLGYANRDLITIRKMVENQIFIYFATKGFMEAMLCNQLSGMSQRKWWQYDPSLDKRHSYWVII
jgi:hypothetical protein